MKKIKWAEIEAECGDYRAGFVATFRKYEGQETDEKDGAGRVVKVTVKSFARHAGIAERTFGDWVVRDEGGGRADQRNRGQEHATKALTDPEQRKKVIAELPDEALDAIRQDISEKEAQEVDGPDWEEKQRRRDERWQKWNKETEARKKVDHAYDNLRSRQHFFGEVPINDAEQEQLGWIIQVANYLLGNTELDAELEEILSES